MSDQYVPALRRRFPDDMRIRGLRPKTQTMYRRAMREFTRFRGHSPDTAPRQELRAFQLDMKDQAMTRRKKPTQLHALASHSRSICSVGDAAVNPNPLRTEGRRFPPCQTRRRRSSR
mmetsp:Transcript_23859/g.43194  ORF Transcript_23859/g.43194 Transcript_23859/m.43194 type:complete len:117 (+) Transcript_23859:311-661(+)